MNDNELDKILSDYMSKIKKRDDENLVPDANSELDIKLGNDTSSKSSLDIILGEAAEIDDTSDVYASDNVLNEEPVLNAEEQPFEVTESVDEGELINDFASEIENDNEAHDDTSSIENIESVIPNIKVGFDDDNGDSTVDGYASIEDVADDEDDNSDDVSEEEFDSDDAYFDDEDNVDEQDDNSDDDYDEEDYEDEYEDESDDDEFSEDYKEVKSSRPKLLFNVDKPHEKKKKKKKPNRSIFTSVMIAVIIIAVSIVLSIEGISLGVEYLGLMRDEQSISFSIPKGYNTAQIAELLEEKGIINNPSLFRFVAKLKKANIMYPGNITLSPNMTYPSIIDELCKERSSIQTVEITFIEGVTLYDVANTLEEKGVCEASEFLYQFNKTHSYDFEKELNPSNQALYRMEGFMFPDTYEFFLDDSAENVVTTLREHYQSKMTDEVMSLIKSSDLSYYEIVTLASLVEKEANGYPKEMPKVAAVFLNRLDLSEVYPKLQSDTTYGYYKNVIAKTVQGSTDLNRYKNLYDTYVCNGLPVGPICNPSMDAVMAVLKPEKTNYYYFVTDKNTKEFYYAETNEEHEVNCKKAGY